MFKYSNTNKRYHTLDYYYKNRFNEKIFKVSLNAGFTCPNIDGTKGTGGCIYCLNGSKSIDNLDLLKQFITQKNIEEKKWPNAKYIGYFQANTNTYAPLEVLKEKYELILKQDNVIGLNIATRPDSITKEVYDKLDKVKLCVAYNHNGDVNMDFSTDIHYLENCEAVYEEFDGNFGDISNIKTKEDLPEKAKKYIQRIEEVVGVPVKFIGTGAGRENMIVVK